MCGKLVLADSVEEPQVVVAHSDRSLRVGDRLAELGVENSSTSGGNAGASAQCVFRILARHELASRAFYKSAAEREVVESLTLRGGEKNRASERQSRLGESTDIYKSLPGTVILAPSPVTCNE